MCACGVSVRLANARLTYVCVCVNMCVWCACGVSVSVCVTFEGIQN